jgi:hypothetical protein
MRRPCCTPSHKAEGSLLQLTLGVALALLGLSPLAACEAKCRPGTIRYGEKCIAEKDSPLAADAGEAISSPGAGEGGSADSGAGGSQSPAAARSNAAGASGTGNSDAPSPTSGAGGAAAPSAASPTAGCEAEICDNTDNDCDGKVDEAVTRSCGPMTAVGICRPGTETCSAGSWSECAGAAMALEEVCDADGLDENCDGAVNEGCGCTAGDTQVCGNANGTCKQGMQTCVDGQWAAECVGKVDPSKEVCDATMLDEDCDGTPNQGCDCIDGEEETCQGQDVGECMPGTRTCADGNWSACSGVVARKSEKCDSVDNDCDNTVDEDSCASGQQCVSGRCVQCAGNNDCAGMSDDCNDGVCQNGMCRRTAKARGTECGGGLCDQGTCQNVECFTASDCSGSGARCTDGECVICGDRKVSAGEQCDIGAPKQPGDQLATQTYDEFSCDPRTCRRRYLYTPCTVDTTSMSSSECGGEKCNGQLCLPNAGCNGEGACTLSNGSDGFCYGNTCFILCSSPADCPSTLTCGEPGGSTDPRRFCN